jgi:hypothetical protein
VRRALADLWGLLLGDRLYYARQVRIAKRRARNMR